MTIEGVLLTGGASRRMGTDKSVLLIEGETIAGRIARGLSQSCEQVTVLGRSPLAGYGFLEDQAEFAGPLIALSRFVPSCDAVFVASCDLPRFDGRLAGAFADRLNGWDAILPLVDQHLQPLCALYAATSWHELQQTVESGQRSLMAWIDRLQILALSPEDLAETGIDFRTVLGANSPEDWNRLLNS